MAATAGECFHQQLSFFDDCGCSQGEAGVFSGDQQVMGDVFPDGGGIAPMAAGAGAPLAVVERMAGEAERARLGRAVSGGDQAEKKD